jgi:peroxiredoxin
MLNKDTIAPDFELYATPDQKFSLHELKGRNVILAFYPADWSPVCGDEMSLFNEMLHFFRKFNAELLGISVDGKWCHAAFRKSRNLHFTLLADFEPKGAVAKQYGAYNEKEGLCERALFILDSDGIIQWSYLSPVGINPGADGIIEALEMITQKTKYMAKLTPPVNKHDHIKGPRNASVELVEFGDYQCPHCGAAHPVVKAIERAFSSNLAFVYRHFPLSEVHPHAEAAAVAAEAAGKQGKFWLMHDMIFENQFELSSKALFAFAAELELEMTAFEMDIMDQALFDKVEANFESGVRSGVNGTPSFFINGYKYNGPYDFESMAGTIEAMLTERRHIET